MEHPNLLAYNMDEKVKGVQFMSVPKDDLEQLLDNLNDKNKVVAKSFLSWLLDNQLDEDDEYLTPADIEAIEKGRIEFQKGQTKSLEDMKRELEI